MARPAKFTNDMVNMAQQIVKDANIQPDNFELA